MPDDESDDQRTDSAGVEPQGEPESQPGKEPVTLPRRTHRPRPVPTSGYVPGRRSRVEETHTMNPYIVPVVALVALVALLVALVVAKVHNSSNASAGPTSTVTAVPVSPSATPRPTATPMKVATPLTTKAGVAAVVNGESIPMSLYVDYSNSAIAGLQADHQDQTTGATIKAIDVRTTAGKAAVKQTRQQVLDSLIQNYTIVAYARDHHLMPTQAEITTVISGYYTQGGGKDAFLKMATSEGFTSADVNEIASTTAAIQSVMTKVTANIACKPCGERHARHILFKATDQKLATTVAKHLQADKGSDFAAYAKKYSTDTGSAKQGGDLGWFEQSAMVKEFGDAAFALKIGQVSNPVKSTYGWHVIQVLGERASSTQKSDYFTTWVGKMQKAAVTHTYVKL
jgi:parvulin-like peptidyl-prolyl isomerase